jgi:hypothetical protein
MFSEIHIEAGILLQSHQMFVPTSHPAIVPFGHRLAAVIAKTLRLSEGEEVPQPRHLHGRSVILQQKEFVLWNLLFKERTRHKYKITVHDII